MPPALNPTIPPVISFLVYRAKESDVRPVRPGPAAPDRAVRRPAPGVPDLGPLRQPGAVRGAGGFVGIPRRPRRRSSLRRYHDRVDCVVHDGGGVTILDVSLVDPVPVTGHDVQYPPGMHLARIVRDGVLKPRIVQVDSEYEFRRADRGVPSLARVRRRGLGRRASGALPRRLGQLRGLRHDHRQRPLHLQSRHPGRRRDGEGQRQVSSGDRRCTRTPTVLSAGACRRRRPTRGCTRPGTIPTGRRAPTWPGATRPAVSVATTASATSSTAAPPTCGAASTATAAPRFRCNGEALPLVRLDEAAGLVRRAPDDLPRRRAAALRARRRRLPHGARGRRRG